MASPRKSSTPPHATSTGGREGTSKTDDGVLDVKLTTPKELGGNGARRHQPRAAVRGRLLGLLHRRDEARREAAEDRAAGRHLDHRRRRHRPDPERLRHPGRAARQIPGMERARRPKKLVEAAHQVCPYSNATRGNIDVDSRRRLSRRGSGARRRSAPAAVAAISSTRACTGVSAPADGKLGAVVRAAERSRRRRSASLRSTATPRATASSQRRLERAMHACRCRCRRRRCRRRRARRSARDAARRRRRRGSATISTRGQAPSVAERCSAEPSGCPAGQSRSAAAALPRSRASGPASPDANASSR